MFTATYSRALAASASAPSPGAKDSIGSRRQYRDMVFTEESGFGLLTNEYSSSAGNWPLSMLEVSLQHAFYGEFAQQPVTPSDEKVIMRVLHSICGLSLKAGLDVYIESDGSGVFVAQTPDFPVFGSGDTEEEAVKDFSGQLVELHGELSEDVPMTQHWAKIKKRLYDLLPPEAGLEER